MVYFLTITLLLAGEPFATTFAGTEGFAMEHCQREKAKEQERYQTQVGSRLNGQVIMAVITSCQAITRAQLKQWETQLD